jgi:hypothetical protein
MVPRGNGDVEMAASRDDRAPARHYADRMMGVAGSE